MGILAPTQTNEIGAVWIRQFLQLNLGAIIIGLLVRSTIDLAVLDQSSRCITVCEIYKQIFGSVEYDRGVNIG